MHLAFELLIQETLYGIIINSSIYSLKYKGEILKHHSVIFQAS